MPRLESEPVVRIHIWLYKRDVERVHALYDARLGFSKAIRLMVRKFLSQLEAQAPEPIFHVGEADEEIILEALEDE